MPQRIYGHILGYPLGSMFETRADLSYAGVHTPRRAGIAGSGREAAESIVLSGGYEDDLDHGDEIIYTGQGGRDRETGVQITHQILTKGNLALVCSQQTGLPVRVVRGSQLQSPDAPPVGYRYDGLYRVVEHWCERGKSGWDVWRFRLRKVALTPSPSPMRGRGAGGEGPNHASPAPISSVATGRTSAARPATPTSCSSMD